MRKFLVTLLVFLAIVGGVLYYFSSTILEKASVGAIDFLTENVKVPNLEYTKPTFKSVGISSYNAITWHNLATNITMVRNDIKNQVVKVSAKMDSFTISLGSVTPPTFIISIKGFTASKEEKGGAYQEGAPDGIKSGDLKAPLKLGAMSLGGIVAEVRGFSDELKKFSQSGVTKIPIQFSAEETFVLKGKPCTARISIVREGDEYRLIMDENDLKKIGSNIGGTPPTAGDIKVLARNPIKAPQMLRIRNKAATTAQLAHQANPAIPEDAYRHTYWAYLLTKAYDEKFAQQVGDGHESEADKEEITHAGSKSFEAASYQDFNNNAAGRRYAVTGVPESSILQRVLSDPAIIRDNETMLRFNPSEYMRYKRSVQLK